MLILQSRRATVVAAQPLSLRRTRARAAATRLRWDARSTVGSRLSAEIFFGIIIR